MQNVTGAGRTSIINGGNFSVFRLMAQCHAVFLSSRVSPQREICKEQKQWLPAEAIRAQKKHQPLLAYFNVCKRLSIILHPHKPRIRKQLCILRLNPQDNRVESAECGIQSPCILTSERQLKQRDFHFSPH